MNIVDDAAHGEFDLGLSGRRRAKVAVGVHGAEGEGADGGADDSDDDEAGDEFEEGECAGTLFHGRLRQRGLLI